MTQALQLSLAAIFFAIVAFDRHKLLVLYLVSALSCFLYKFPFHKFYFRNSKNR